MKLSLEIETIDRSYCECCGEVLKYSDKVAVIPFSSVQNSNDPEYYYYKVIKFDCLKKLDSIQESPGISGLKQEIDDLKARLAYLEQHVVVSE